MLITSGAAGESTGCRPWPGARPVRPRSAPPVSMKFMFPPSPAGARLAGCAGRDIGNMLGRAEVTPRPMRSLSCGTWEECCPPRLSLRVLRRSSRGLAWLGACLALLPLPYRRRLCTALSSRGGWPGCSIFITSMHGQSAPPPRGAGLALKRPALAAAPTLATSQLPPRGWPGVFG
jgi:hypothetical protein